MPELLRPRILIVEDNHGLAEEFRISLQKTGESRIVERTEEVFFEMANFDPDVILLDIILEGDKVHSHKDAGIKILEKIKELRHPFREIPVIVVTGRIEPHVEAQCRSIGVANFFRKPVSIKKLRNAVEKALREHGRTNRYLKIFVSSTMDELSNERRAVKDKIEAMSPFFKVEIAEDWAARPEPVQKIWQQAAEACDVLILILGEKYGHPLLQSGGISATEDEYTKAHEKGKPVLVFVKDTSAREPRLMKFYTRLINPTTGHLVRYFSNVDDLSKEVKKAIIQIASKFGVAASRD